MRNAAIPALTRGWFSAPANSRLVDAARTRPPAVSAVIRLRASLAGARAFFPGVRLGDSARPRGLADAGVAGLPLGANLAAVSIAGAGPVCATAFCSGIGDAGLDGTGTGTGLRAGADSNLAGEAGAGLGIATEGFTAASGGFGAAAGCGASRGRSRETSGLRSLRNSSTLSSTRLTGRGGGVLGGTRLAPAAPGVGAFRPPKGAPPIAHSS